MMLLTTVMMYDSLIQVYGRVSIQRVAAYQMIHACLHVRNRAMVHAMIPHARIHAEVHAILHAIVLHAMRHANLVPVGKQYAIVHRNYDDLQRNCLLFI